MNEKPVLYLGDSSLQSAAGYLAGLMTAFGIDFDHVPSDSSVSPELISKPRKLFVVSDYSSRLLPTQSQEEMLAQVRRGAGLLMIGGWESFRGHGGNWAGTPIGNALPVDIANEDDRINCDQPALVIKASEHEIVRDLPWDARPPTVGGYNLVKAKAQATVVLTVQRFAAKHESGRFDFTPEVQGPMLVTGTFGDGRTAALATDLAPHWVGGLVDWGDRNRITAKAAGSWQIEVGNFYAQFVRNLLTWTGKFTDDIAR